MKKKNGIWVYPIIVMGLVLMLTNSCQKANDGTNIISDIDGNVYHTVTIGTQVWMIENLKTTKYRNGDLIGTTVPSTLDISGESTPKYQWAFSGNESNVSTYGRLYTAYAVQDSRALCPTGWHVPNEYKLITLTTTFGSDSLAGINMKEAGTTHWQSPNPGATNASGFTALPGGNRSIDGSFNLKGNNGYWWTSSGYSTGSTWVLLFVNNNSSSSMSTTDNKYGLSVRCVKD